MGARSGGACAWLSGHVAEPARALGPRLLDGVERVGNALPHPATLFVVLSAVVVLLSWMLSTLGVQVMHPLDRKSVV